MEKVKHIKTKGKYTSNLTESFRELITKEIGKLDTATSFMYLFRRFGEPALTNKDEYKILYDYRFKHEDILITVHASYHEFVYFSLHFPEKRLNAWFESRQKFLKTIYKKNNDIPFMPYTSSLYTKHQELTKSQNKKNWKLVDAAFEKFFSKEDIDYINSQLKSRSADSKTFKMLQPFEQKLCKEFREKLSKEELSELQNWMPKIENVSGLKEQCMYVIDEMKKGVYVRDVPINICGYESATNVINQYAEEK